MVDPEVPRPAIPLPAALVPPDRTARRASWRRRLRILVVLLLLVVPPMAWAWVGRGTSPSDGVFTYPSDPPWSDSGGVAVADVLDPDVISAVRDGKLPGCLLRRDDRVVAIEGIPLSSWVRGTAGRPAPAIGEALDYTVDPPDGPPCLARVTLREISWSELVRQHFSVLILAAVMWLVASVVFLQRPRDQSAQALFMLALLVPYGVTAWPLAFQVVDLTQGPRLWPFVWGEVANALLWGATLHFAAVFPRPLGVLQRRPWLLLVLYVVPFVLHLAYVALGDPGVVPDLLAAVLPGAHAGPDLDTWALTLPVSVAASRLAPALCGATLLWQYLHVRGPDERRRMQWVIYSFLGIAAIYLALLQIPAWLLNRPLISQDLQVLLFVVVPLALGAAVLRYGIFDLQIILRRSLVYGALTTALVVVPGLLTLLVAGLVGARPSGWDLALTVAVVVALFFQTMRTRLKRRLSRLVFGERDDPYELVAQVGGRLQSGAPAESVLSSVVETVAHALRLPYVAIELVGPDGVVDSQAYGQQQGEVLRLPLLHQGEAVGTLQLDQGTGREPFGPADRRLVELLTQQVGLAAQSALLTARLQRSLQRAVVAREEERRRLRRDIHDGLGPMLAATKLQLEVLQGLMSKNPARVAPMLERLVETQEAVILDVRRLVEGLRPPVLDQLGLVSALRERAASLSSRGDDASALSITVDAAPDVEPLPAAVEVAAYRVVLEALTNVTRHASATECRVRLWRADALLVEVTDNGRGLPEVYRAGVGLGSMRERASELGGSCTITPGSERGTVVRARFPVFEASGRGTRWTGTQESEPRD